MQFVLKILLEWDKYSMFFRQWIVTVSLLNDSDLTLKIIYIKLPVAFPPKIQKMLT